MCARFSLLILIILLTEQCSQTNEEKEGKVDINPLCTKWEGPYGGVPPFDRIKPEHFRPALQIASRSAAEELDRLVSDESTPTFENTIEDYERIGKRFADVERMIKLWAFNKNDSVFRTAREQLFEQMTSHSDSVYQNGRFFQRVDYVYRSTDFRSLSVEKRRLTQWIRTKQLNAGAHLNSDSKKQLATINRQLSRLYNAFSDNILAEEEHRYVAIESEKQLDGLSDSFKKMAATAAKELKVPNKWVIANTYSMVEHYLTFASDRIQREKVWMMSARICDRGDSTDNNAIIEQIIDLRRRRARLLGFETFADLALADRMAKTPTRVLELLREVWTPAVAAAQHELAELQQVAIKEDAQFKIEPWDYKYYTEKLRKLRFDFDQKDVEPYLQLQKIREAAFWVAKELFDFNFKKIDGIPVFHKDVEVYEVSKGSSASVIGLWYFDPYVREGKRSGAWMNFYRRQQKLDYKTLPLVSNNTNFVRPPDGEPALISIDDAVTLFHEFGHALHALASDVTYATLASPHLPLDYIETPSLMLENWLFVPEVLNRFALHYRTNQPVPDALIANIVRSRQFMAGLKNTKYLASALIDMKIHVFKQNVKADQFEREAIRDLELPDNVKVEAFLPQFSHIFDSEDYAAGYYSYLWSEIFADDTFAAFKEGSGPFDKQVAGNYLSNILAVGNSVDPAEAYRNFRGRDVKIDAFINKYGLKTAQ